MPKYLIITNAGYGDNEEVIEAENQEDANKAAYEAWREEAENNGEYRALLLTKEIAEEHGFTEELED